MEENNSDYFSSKTLILTAEPLLILDITYLDQN
jgi:hypothetical protein